MAVARANSSGAVAARDAAPSVTGSGRHPVGPAPRVLVVAEDPAVSARATAVLREAGFEVGTASSATPVRDAMLDGKTYELIVMDTDLPGAQGFAVLEALRKWGVETPVLLMTAGHDAADTIRGLDLGADDVASRTCDAAELRARVGALLRRLAAPRAPEFRVGDLRFDPDSRQATRGGRAIPLTGREARLLEYLMRNHGRVVTKTMVLDHVWGRGVEGESNMAEVNMSYRRRTNDGARPPPLLHTNR